MPMLPSRHYVSDHTRFIRELLESVLTENGYRVLKLPADVAADRALDEGRVAQKAYVYSTDAT